MLFHMVWLILFGVMALSHCLKFCNCQSYSSISGFLKANIHTKVDHTMKWCKWSAKIVCIFVWGHHYFGKMCKCMHTKRNACFLYFRHELASSDTLRLPGDSDSFLQLVYHVIQIAEGVITAGALNRSGKRVLLALSKSAGVWPNPLTTTLRSPLPFDC